MIVIRATQRLLKNSGGHARRQPERAKNHRAPA